MTIRQRRPARKWPAGKVKRSPPQAERTAMGTQPWPQLLPRARSRHRGASHRREIAFRRLSPVIREAANAALSVVGLLAEVGADHVPPAAQVAAVPRTPHRLRRPHPRRAPLPAAARTKRTFASRNRNDSQPRPESRFLCLKTQLRRALQKKIIPA